MFVHRVLKSFGHYCQKVPTFALLSPAAVEAADLSASLLRLTEDATNKKVLPYWFKGVSGNLKRAPIPFRHLSLAGL